MIFTVDFNGYPFVNGFMITPVMAGFIVAFPLLLILVSATLAETKVLRTVNAALYIAIFYGFSTSFSKVMQEPVVIEQFHMIFAVACMMMYFTAGVGALVMKFLLKIGSKRLPSLGAFNIGITPYLLILTGLFGGVFGLYMPMMFTLLLIAQSIKAQISWRPTDFSPM